ncbi:MAG: TIGR03067 domain-containing protein [Bryobacteraceae bacterium]
MLAKLRDGDRAAAQAFARHLPEAGKLTLAQIRERGFRLADAQAVVARKSGFAEWPGLARHVDRLRAMEGTWAFRSLEVDGGAVPAAMLSASRLLIDGDRFRMESPEATYEGLFTIDVEAAPPRIDIDFHEGPESGNRCEGLFELEGDRFRICLALAGSQRPEAFATSPGSGCALEELVRVEHTRPPAVDGGVPPAPRPPVPEVAVVDRAGFDGPLTPTIEKLQGDWAAVELVASGVATQAAYLPYGLRTHAGTEAKVVFGGQTMLHAKMRFDEASSPVTVDYLNLSGRGKRTISLGLFRWIGDEAEFCMGSPGAPRPNDFTSGPGSGRILSRWRRKPAR